MRCQGETSCSLIPRGALEHELRCRTDATLRCGGEPFPTPGQVLLNIGCLGGEGVCPKEAFWVMGLLSESSSPLGQM